MFSLMGLKYLYIIFRLMEFFLSISYWVDLLSYHILNFILFFIYNFSKRYMYIPFLHFERVCRISDFIFGATGVALLCVHVEHLCCSSFCWSRSYRYINHSKLAMKRCLQYQFLQKTPFSENRAWCCLIRNYKCKAYCLRMCSDMKTQ